MKTVEESLSEIVEVLSAPWTIKEWLVTIAPLIISFLSIFFAVYVPYRIMSKQNKIALFDKHFSIYQQVKEILGFSFFIDKIGKLPLRNGNSSFDCACHLFSLWCSKRERLADAFKLLQKEPNNGNIKLNMLTLSSEVLQEQVIILETSEYLLNESISEPILLLSKKYNAFMTLVIGSLVNEDMKEYETKKNDLCDFIRTNTDILKNFEMFLKL